MDEHGEMKRDANTIAKEALDAMDGKDEKEVAAYIKRKFDAKYGPTWHCVVGTDFKANVSHERKTFMFTSVGKTSILLFRCG
jgi:dynein light chain LC8-type